MLNTLDVVDKPSLIEYVYSLQVLPTEDSKFIFTLLLSKDHSLEKISVS